MKDELKGKLTDALIDEAQDQALSQVSKNAGDKADLLRDMPIDFASKQTQSEEEVVADYLKQQSDAAVDKSELLKDMPIDFTSTQTQSEEEVIADYLKQQNPTPVDKAALLDDMEIDYSSKQVQSEEEVVDDYVKAKPVTPSAPAEPSAPAHQAKAPAPAPAGSEAAVAPAGGYGKPLPMPVAIGDVNTLVIESPVKVAIETLYDRDLEDNWNDRCVLWTVKDGGQKYTRDIQLTDATFVTLDKRRIQVLFDDVPAFHRYSCAIRASDTKSIILFQNLEITEDMAFRE